MTSPAARSDEATTLYRALRDALWQINQGYTVGAQAIIANAVHAYKSHHPEMR